VECVEKGTLLSAKTDLTYKVQLLVRGVANVTCDVKLRAPDLIFMVDSEVTSGATLSAAEASVQRAFAGFTQRAMAAWMVGTSFHLSALPPSLPPSPLLYSQSAALEKGTVVTANKGTAEVKPEAKADIYIHILTLPPTLPLSLPPSLPSPNHSQPLSAPEEGMH